MTAADLVGLNVPDNAAEDSFSLLPIFQGTDHEPIRPFLLQQAIAGARDLAIRRGKWKYLCIKVPVETTMRTIQSSSDMHYQTLLQHLLANCLISKKIRAKP